MDKRAARNLVVQRLKRSRDVHDDARLYQHLFALAPWRRAQVVAVTLSTSIEIPTRPIIQRAWREHKRVVVPKVLPKRKMQFFALTPETKLIRDRFGILETVASYPVKKDQIDLIVVPGLAFTISGFRLGFGGGYYDRYLKGYHGFTVALARSQQMFGRPIWPVSSQDVAVDQIIND